MIHGMGIVQWYTVNIVLNGIFGMFALRCICKVTGCILLLGLVLK